MFLIIDKPAHITSHGVIARLRQITNERKIGHAGTLDPNATGLLIVGIGRDSTRRLGDLTTKSDKTYDAEVVLGETRDTDDSEGMVLEQFDVQTPPAVSQIKKVLSQFEGHSFQLPPNYSAIKLSGRKAYEIARKGEIPQLSKRKITIYSIELIEYAYPTLKFIVKVSSGTYIRALARDIGAKLGTGGYLANLRRTAVGNFNVGQAVELDSLAPDNWQDFTIAID